MMRWTVSGTDWEALDVTDGWNWRQPGGTPAPAYPPVRAGQPVPTTATATTRGGPSTDVGAPGSPWWSDALADPWRDPHAPTALVLQAAPAGGTAEPEPVQDPDAPTSRRLGPVFLISLVTALLAGMLGGALGYAFAVRGGVGGGTALGAQPGEAPAAAQRRPDSLAGVAERVLPSVVTVRVSGRGGTSVGSGFVASADGYVITNDHVVEVSSGRATVTFNDGSTAPATVVGKDPESDIAVIKVSRTGLRPVEFGDSEALAVGDPVLAFGSPLSLANTVTAGIVSALDRTIRAGEPGGTTRYYAAIQTDAAVNQGNSGGPLVDGAGRVIGVNSVIKSLAADAEEAGNIGLAFAIPINQAKRITQDIIDTGKARRTVIGATVGDAGSGAASGVRLSAVEPSGPAATGGLRAGDVILRLAGRPLAEPSDLIALVRKHAPGSVVTVEYRRGSDRQNTSVTLAADVK
ncbi:trypsin-like peptidase domain-containing protein [Micromonospora sp. CPCC 206060]